MSERSESSSKKRRLSEFTNLEDSNHPIKSEVSDNAPNAKNDLSFMKIEETKDMEDHEDDGNTTNTLDDEIDSDQDASSDPSSDYDEHDIHDNDNVSDDEDDDGVYVNEYGDVEEPSIIENAEDMYWHFHKQAFKHYDAGNQDKADEWAMSLICQKDSPELCRAGAHLILTDSPISSKYDSYMHAKRALRLYEHYRPLYPEEGEGCVWIEEMLEEAREAFQHAERVWRDAGAGTDGFKDEEHDAVKSKDGKKMKKEETEKEEKTA